MKKRKIRILSLALALVLMISCMSFYAFAENVSLAKPKVSISAYTTPALKVSWNSIPDATKYYVYRKVGTSGNFSLIAKTEKLSYKDKDVKEDILYSYKVRAYQIKNGKIVNKSEPSDTVKKVILDIKAVKNLKAETVSTSKIKLSWNKVEGANRYYIYYATKKDQSSYKALGYVSATTHTLSGLMPGTTYYFKVKAKRNVYGANYGGKYSEIVYAKTQTKPGEYMTSFEKISNKEAGLPTGSPMTCLAMMIKFYHGIDVDPNDLLKYFNCSTKFYKDSDGKLWGPDSGQYFVGNPKSTTLYGCGCDINIVQNAYKSFTDEHKLVNYTAIPFKEKFSVFNWQFDESKKFLEAGNILIVKFNTKKTLSDDYMFWMYYDSRNNAYGAVVDPNERYGILCGYTNNGYIIYNPLTDVYEKYDVKNITYNLINAAHEFDKK